MTPVRRVPLLIPLVLLLLLSAATPVSAESPAPSPAATTPAPSPSPAGAGGTTGATTTLDDSCDEPTPSAAPSPGQTLHPVLCPAEPRGADPVGLLSWLFTPIFQALFLGLVAFYTLFGDIGLAIVALTIVIRLLLVPVFKAQIVSQRRMQLLQPELRALATKYKGDRAKISQEQMRLYKERGVNPASGCLPALLQLILLIPIYSVFSSGLSARNISSMLQVFGFRIIDVQCQSGAATGVEPCIDPAVHWLPAWQLDPVTGPFLNASRPEVLFYVPGIAFGISVLALIAALLQLVQTRMMQPATNDPQVRAQQRIFLILPLFSLIYGALLPAGLFLYWIVTTIFSIVQQYLIAGWGSLFPLFGWTPGFARDHKPRFTVTSVPPPPNGNDDRPPPTRRTAAERAAGTVRPARSGGRNNRRGRRR